MDNVERTSGGWGRRLIIGGFALLGVIVTAAAVISAWQADVRSSKSEEKDTRSSTVSLLQTVEEEADIAATLLQQYVAEGDDTLIADIQTHSNAAMGALTEAASQSDTADIDEIAADGAGLSEGASQVIALRLSDDAEGAAAALEEISPAFEEMNVGLAAVAEQELQEIDALQGRVDTADDRADWALIVTVAAGATLGFALLALVARSLISRRPSRPALPV